MLIPAKRLLWIAAALLALAVLASLFPQLRTAWLVVMVLAGLFAAADAVAALRIAPPAALRLVPGSLALGVRHEVGLRFANAVDAPLEVLACDHAPGGTQVEGQPQRVTLAGRGWAEMRYGLRPLARGDLAFGRVELRLASRAGLWQVRRMAGDPGVVRVYPNFAALTRFALLATDHRLSQLGILQRRRRGEGLDFHQLRDYREGDTPRQVDWSATSRIGKLISREYQDERDQQVLLLIDCGRRMAAKDSQLSHFDCVLNAALLLAYVSVRQGDAVGFLTMSGTERWFAPRKTASTVSLILNRVYDLAPTLHTTDYHAAAVSLMQRVKKRALVIVLTNLRDEDDDTLAPALRLLQSRHLVLFASLREAILTRALAARVDSFDRALTHAAAADYLHRRELAFRRLARGGAVCLDVEPEDLPVALVNRYLDIKRSGRL
ncbi:MAG: DUF58 domain-containing protein [Burkholderiales bacterium]